MTTVGSESALRKFDIASHAKRAKNKRAMGTIPSETIEQIAAANDIVEVIGSYFPLKRAGANFKALCPFHQEKTPSFTVSPQRQTFHCFGCGVGGSVFRFVMDYEHLDFPSAVRKLAARAGITGGRRTRRERRRRSTARDAPHVAEVACRSGGMVSRKSAKREIGEPAREYLKKRGIDGEIAKRLAARFRAGEWDAFWQLGTRRRLSTRANSCKAALIKTKDDDETSARCRTSYDRFRGRIMFPICNDVGEVIAFSGRVAERSRKAREISELAGDAAFSERAASSLACTKRNAP